ncbi:MAG TPA: RNA polymerase sigma factor [Humisphaera sp.]
MDRPDPAEFRRLVLAELPAVHRLAVHLARSRERADDLVQETYLRAFRSAGTFRTTEFGPRPWLFKILHNAWRSRMAQKAPATGGEEVADQTAAPEPVPLDLDWDQVDERLKRAIEELPDNYRDVLLLWAVEGLKYREIADVTGVPIGTVMSRLYRARQLLMTSLAPLAAEHRIGADVTEGEKQEARS